MAEQNSRDVVTKALSVDDQSFTDVSATQKFDSVARAATEKPTSVHLHTITPIDLEPPLSLAKESEQPVAKAEILDQANLHESEVSYAKCIE